MFNKNLVLFILLFKDILCKKIDIEEKDIIININNPFIKVFILKLETNINPLENSIKPINKHLIRLSFIINFNNVVNNVVKSRLDIIIDNVFIVIINDLVYVLDSDIFLYS